MTDTFTRDDILAEMKRTTLRELDSTALSLRGVLAEVNRDALRAIEAINTGMRISGMSIGTGPLGHQAPADVVKLSARLETLLNQAHMLGCSEAEILSAYTQS